MEKELKDRVIEAALVSGIIEDCSYVTPSCGHVTAYSGRGFVEIAGRLYAVVGYKPEGTPQFVFRSGSVVVREFPEGRFSR